jgi:transposase-like protein
MDKAKKMVYLAITEASKKWTMPIHNWRQAMVRFIVEFVDRLEKHIK